MDSYAKEYREYVIRSKNALENLREEDVHAFRVMRGMRVNSDLSVSITDDTVMGAVLMTDKTVIFLDVYDIPVWRIFDNLSFNETDDLKIGELIKRGLIRTEVNGSISVSIEDLVNRDLICSVEGNFEGLALLMFAKDSDTDIAIISEQGC